MTAHSGSRIPVLATSRFVAPVEDALEKCFEIVFEASDDALAAVAAARVRQPEPAALLVSLGTELSAEVIGQLPASLRAVATYSVGTDHIDLAAAEARGLAVFNTPGVLGDAVAENAMLLMLATARRATEAIELVRSGRWSGWSPTQLVGRELAGRTLGIVGLGDIGRRIAVRAQAFGMDVLYCNRRRLADDAEAGFGYRATPEALIGDVDVLLVACPSTPETRGLVDARLLAAARPGLLLVNIARGELVVDEALVAALSNGTVWGAGLDVFDGEPDYHPAYADLPNVFMLPHTGSSTEEARGRMGAILITALEAFFAGRSAPNRVV